MPASIPRRIALAQLPTPLVRLERLSAELGGEIWVKRDDLTGVEFSGNKIRKLEYVLADAVDHGADTLVTEGTPQSNHCRATAAACARLGLHAMLLLRPPPPAAAAGNFLLDRLFGAEFRGFERAEYKAARDRIVADALAELRARGRTPRWTPAGASEPLGCWGYIDALGELGGQLRAAGVRACDVVVGVSSDATLAGAVLGKLLHGLDGIDLVGVPVSDDARHHADETRRLCREASEIFGLGVDAGPLLGAAAVTDRTGPLRLIEGYVGEGYGLPTAEGLDAMGLLARREAIVLDPVYSAKAFAAVVGGVRDGSLGRRRPVVFIHTGGIFSNFAWPELVVSAYSQGQGEAQPGAGCG